jgi:hypothetical protein
MPDDPRPPGGMTFEQFTETTLNAIFRAARTQGLTTHGQISIGVLVGPGGGYGGHMMTCGFAAVIKPFFTACYQDHMKGFFDLWDPAQVKAHWQGIFDTVQSGSMPASSPPCPGTFNKSGFLQAFQCWKDQGFPP